MYIKRTVILSKIGLENKKALATIQNNGNGKLSVLAKFQEAVGEVYALVRFANSPIEVIPLCYNQCEDCFNGCLPEYFNCNEEIFIMVVCIANGRIIPVYLGGGNERRNCFYDEVLKNLPFYYGKCMSLSNKNVKNGINNNKNLNFANQDEYFNENSENCIKSKAENLNNIEVNNMAKLKAENAKVNNVQNVHNPSGNDEELFKPLTENEIDEVLTNSLLTECLTQKDKCENCAYKKAFYENDYVDENLYNDIEDANLFNKNANISVYERLVAENQKEVNALKESVKSEISQNNAKNCPENSCVEFNATNEASNNANKSGVGDLAKNNLMQNENAVNEGGNNASEGNGEISGEDMCSSNNNEEEGNYNNDNVEDDKKALKFYKQIEKSLNALFTAYPADNVLEEKLEGGKFAKVDYENTGDYYSVGYISENGQPKYICYAIPCKAGSPPPKNMEEFSQYLPIDEGCAYYLMYQSASDGKTIQF